MIKVDGKLKRARDLLFELSRTKEDYNEIKAKSLSKADDSFNETLGVPIYRSEAKKDY
jgi:hypothetical protein